MDIVITINEQDLRKNPSILDMVKGFAEGLAEPAAEAPESNLAVQKIEPQKETPTAQVQKEETTVEAATEGAAESAVSVEEVRAALAKVNKKHGAARAKAILQEHGADNLSGLDTAVYAAVLEEAKAVL